MVNQRTITVAALSFATVLLFNYIFTDHTGSSSVVSLGSQKLRPGTAYSLPKEKDLLQPAQREVEFTTVSLATQPEAVRVQTDLVQATFSTHGAALSSLEFLAHPGKSGQPLRTLQPKNFNAREDSAFLIALDERTPYEYKLVHSQKTDDSHAVKFATQYNGWTIEKEYLFDQKSHKVDVKMHFAPAHSAQPIRPRLFVPSPYVPEVAQDMAHGIVSKPNGKSLQQVASKRLFGQAWITPTMVGAADKYFAHIVTHDADSFIQRAYFKQQAQNGLHAILEGPRIETEQTYTISLYMGPKTYNALTAHDTRLEGLLYFGYLSGIAKLLLRGLNTMHDYTNNYGFAIIFLVLLLKILMMPLALKGRSMMVGYQRHNSQFQYLRKKYGNDQQRLHEEIMNYCRQHNISPLAPAMGIVGCFFSVPSLLIVIAFYGVLQNAIELYNAPFILWLRDLSTHDPYYLLPLTAAGSVLYTMLNSGQKQHAVSAFIIPLVLFTLFLKLPAGLLLAIIANGVGGVVEMSLSNRLVKA